MQHIYEQYGKWFSSLLPAHWTKAIFLTSLPSDGLRILPDVGPFGEASLSICMLVMTFLIFPAPRLSSFDMSYKSQPVARTTELTFRLTVSGFISR